MAETGTDSETAKTGASNATNNDPTDSASKTEEGEFTLLLFASAQSYADLDSLTLPAPMTLRQLFEELEARFPGMKRKVLRSAAVVVNLEYVEFEVDPEGGIIEGGDVKIGVGDEVGIIPPVSSG